MGVERGGVPRAPGTHGRLAAPRRGAGRRRDRRRHHRRPAAVDPLRAAAAGLILALLCASAGAQDGDALAEFTSAFSEAVRSSGRSDPEALQRSFQLLDRCSELIGDLPEERRDLAAFFVEVRRGELHLRSGGKEDLERAAEVTRAARDRARERDVYQRSAYYRPLALVILWQALPPGGFAAILEEDVGGATERAYLLDPGLETTELASASYLIPPVRILRSDLLMGTAAEYRGLQILRELAGELEGATDPGLRRWHDMSVQRLAWYFMQRYSYDRARVYLEQLPEEESLYARGWIALRVGDHGTAEEVGLRLAEGRNDDRYYQLVGDARELEGRFEDALVAYDRAWAAARSAKDRAAARNGRGDALLGLRRRDEAEASYREVLDQLTPLLPDRTLSVLAEWAETIKDMGRVEEARGEWDLAFDWYWRALVALDEARRTIPVDLFGGTWLGQHRDQLSAVDGILRVAPGAQPDPFRVLAATEKLKARSLLDSLARGRPADDPALRLAVRRLAAATDPEEIQDGLLDLETERAAAGPGGPMGEPLEADALREWWREQEDTLVLSYWLGEDRAWLLHGESEGEPRLVNLGPASEARERLRDAYAAVADPVGDPWPALDRAATFFLPPSLDESLARGGRVLVCPDTSLARLPFAALRWQGEALGISHALASTPSLSALATLDHRDARGTGVLVVDSVTRPDLEQELGLDPLVFSKREGDLVAQAYGDARRLEGADATLDNLRALLEAEPPALVHINAHAVEDARVPSQSLLLLADGLVSMRSLAALDLEGSTIVLTACSSALGAERRREGFVGLPQGVLEAGARAVVAPGWSVNQQATADLMGQFHYFLAEGMDEARAMAAARGRLAAAENYAHPHFWAGFTVFGARVRPPAHLPWTLAGAGALLLLTVALVLWRRASAAPRKQLVLGAR